MRVDILTTVYRLRSYGVERCFVHYLSLAGFAFVALTVTALAAPVAPGCSHRSSLKQELLKHPLTGPLAETGSNIVVIVALSTSHVLVRLLYHHHCHSELTGVSLSL